MLKNQRFGVEVEMTGITRADAAIAVTNFFRAKFPLGDIFRKYVGGTYDKWTVTDGLGRKWSLVSDTSIKAVRKVGRQLVSADGTYRVELVTPILDYGDIPLLQGAVRALRAAGAISKAAQGCAIHVHVDAANHNAVSLRNLVNIMASKEAMLFEALQVGDYRRDTYCKPVNLTLVERLAAERPSSLDGFKDVWYGSHYDPFNSRTDVHYHRSRYAALNLHNVWFRGTVEFRLFNGTLHAGEIKAYVQLALAISAQAIAQRSASAQVTRSDNPKFTFRTWLLRMGLIGDEFETARLHLLKNLNGNSAWRYGQAVGR